MLSVTVFVPQYLKTAQAVLVQPNPKMRCLVQDNFQKKKF